MSDKLEFESHKNEVIGMDGEVLSTTSTLTITNPRKQELPRPDEVGTFLLQARHMYNDCEDVTEDVKKLGLDLGSSMLQDTKYRTIKTHYYSWGLFWVTLLKAFKNRQDLKDWSPELFQHDETCDKCNGKGMLLFEVGSDKYNEAYEDMKDFPSDEPQMKYGVDIGLHCTPCQGVGFIYRKPKPEPDWDDPQFWPEDKK